MLVSLYDLYFGKNMEFKKETSYYKNIRRDLFVLLPKKTNIGKVLDVGCGNGRTGYFLKKEFSVKEIIGIEVNETLKKEAEEHLDEVIIGDIEKLELPFKQCYFDYILLADILEHLYDPWSVLIKLRLLLKKHGTLLVSIPNVQHWSIFWGLFRGKWNYTQEGILDNTHIRFFTKKSLIKMFNNNNYKIIKLKRTMGKDIRVLNYMTFGLFSGFLTFRYLISVKKEN